jgi:hypothetical protein
VGGVSGAQIARTNGTTVAQMRAAVIDPVQKHLAGGRLVGGGLGAAYVLTAAADYVGVTVPEMRSELTSGKSLSAIAAEHGKTLSQVTQSVLGGLTSRVDAMLH